MTARTGANRPAEVTGDWFVRVRRMAQVLPKVLDRQMVWCASRLKSDMLLKRMGDGSGGASLDRQV